MLNLDPNDILKQYDSARQDAPSRKSDDVIPQQSSMQKTIAVGKLTERLVTLSPLQRNIALGTFIIAAVTLIIVLANINMGANSQKSAEVPFDRVIRESEAASIPPPSAAVDSTPIINVAKSDSLRLEITTTDSVWISLLIDGKKSEAYLFGANRKRTWAAKERFVVTMGNAGGATFQLNGRDIGALGKRGAIVRNTIITETTLTN
jgi:hypothetical protein